LNIAKQQADDCGANKHQNEKDRQNGVSELLSFLYINVRVRNGNIGSFGSCANRRSDGEKSKKNVRDLLVHVADDVADVVVADDVVLLL